MKSHALKMAYDYVLVVSRQPRCRTILLAIWLAAAIGLPGRGADESGGPTKNVAVLTTVYRHNSHADVIAGRLLLTETLDGRGRRSPLRLASLYTDQRPANDTSRLLSAALGFPIYSNIAGALTLGTGRLAVDGVLLIAEHGDYPVSASGNTQFPKRRFWEETLKVFRASGRVVPVFVDKHLADNWTDAKYIYDTARELKIPLLAGSSVPGTWRHPPMDVTRDAELKEIVALTYHTTDAYGFHALEAVQALAEQRRGGETGVRTVRTVRGADVWQAQAEGRFDGELFRAACGVLPSPLNLEQLPQKVREPKLMVVEYRDGLRVSLLELNGAVGNWSAAWRYRKDDKTAATLFWTQEARPAAHFTRLLHGIEQMMFTGTPPWDVERTLLTSGVLDALLRSERQGGALLPTPELDVTYTPRWRWTEPPPPPPSRPWSDQ